MAVSGIRKYNSSPLAVQSDPFHLGSITKSITATILASYISEGLLTWDTTLQEALPELALIMDQGHQNTTLRMLTAHYSGIVSTQAANRTFRVELLTMTSQAGRLEMVRRELSVPPRNPPNSTFEYDNFNYVLVGLILEFRTKKTYDLILGERLLDPLSMSSCGLGYLAERDNMTIDSPWPHYRSNDSNKTPCPFEGWPLLYRDNPPAEDPAGRLHCPLESLLRYLKLHINGSTPGSSLPVPFSNMSMEDFAFLHIPYRPIDALASTWSYTPGGWLTRSNTPGFSYHDGSNTMNYAYAYVRTGGDVDRTNISGGVVATNIGFDLDGSNTVGPALFEIMNAFVSGEESLSQS